MIKLARKSALIFDVINNVLFGLAVVILAFIMITISVDVVMRYLLDNPIEGVMEITQHSLFYITFLGMAWVMKREGHVKIDVVLNQLNPRSQALINVITSILGIIVALVFLWFSARVFWFNLQGGMLFPGIGAGTFPKAPILVALPVGFLLLLIQFMRRTYEYLQKWRTSQS